MDNLNYTPVPPGGPPPKTPGFAIASLVLGIVSVCLCCCYYYVSLPCAVLSLVFGIITLRKGPAGKGMCIAGIICSAVSIVLAVVLIVVGALFGSALVSMYPELLSELDYYM